MMNCIHCLCMPKKESMESSTRDSNQSIESAVEPETRETNRPTEKDFYFFCICISYWFYIILTGLGLMLARLYEEKINCR